MERKGFLTGIMVLAFGLVLAGCESLDDVVLSDAFLNTASNAHSSNSDTGMVYTLSNQSSHDLTVWDNTGTITLRTGNSIQVRFTKNATLYDVRYTPADLVSVSQSSGTVFTFLDR